jgi:hypothetical protein
MSEQTEVVYTWRPIAEAWVLAYTSWKDLIDEVTPWCDDDIEGKIGTITVERKPVGFVESLTEFEGW